LGQFVVRNRGDVEGLADLRDGIDCRKIIQALAGGRMQSPMKARLNQTRRDLDQYQIEDTRRINPDGALHAEQLLELADPFLPAGDGNENNLARVAGDEAGISEVVGNGRRILALERGAIKIEESGDG
jgi:hypothetical protein